MGFRKSMVKGVRQELKANGRENVDSRTKNYENQSGWALEKNRNIAMSMVMNRKILLPPFKTKNKNDDHRVFSQKDGR
jgi:hypothetical protein